MRTVQIELWQLLTFLVGLTIMGIGSAVAAGKMLLAQAERRLDERFSSLEKARDESRSVCMGRFSSIDQGHREEVVQWQRVERDLLSLRADLPLHYVRREDYVRGQTVIEAKIDAVVLKLENMQLQAMQPGDRRGAHRNSVGEVPNREST